MLSLLYCIKRITVMSSKNFLLEIFCLVPLLRSGSDIRQAVLVFVHTEILTWLVFQGIAYVGKAVCRMWPKFQQTSSLRPSRFHFQLAYFQSMPNHTEHLSWNTWKTVGHRVIEMTTWSSSVSRSIVHPSRSPANTNQLHWYHILAYPLDLHLMPGEGDSSYNQRTSHNCERQKLAEETKDGFVLLSCSQELLVRKDPPPDRCPDRWESLAVCLRPTEAQTSRMCPHKLKQRWGWGSGTELASIGLNWLYTCTQKFQNQNCKNTVLTSFKTKTLQIQADLAKISLIRRHLNLTSTSASGDTSHRRIKILGVSTLTRSPCLKCENRWLWLWTQHLPSQHLLACTIQWRFLLRQTQNFTLFFLHSCSSIQVRKWKEQIWSSAFFVLHRLTQTFHVSWSVHFVRTKNTCFGVECNNKYGNNTIFFSQIEIVHRTWCTDVDNFIFQSCVGTVSSQDLGTLVQTLHFLSGTWSSVLHMVFFIVICFDKKRCLLFLRHVSL